MVHMKVRVFWCGPGRPWISVHRGLLHVAINGAQVKFMSVQLWCTWVEKTHSRFLRYNKHRSEVDPGQDSPFWTLETGGCIKSLKGPRASFRAELTSDEVHVMHSTSVGYRAITWAHVLPSTVGSEQKNYGTTGETKDQWGKEREERRDY